MDKRDKLSSFKKNEGLKTPDNYFESLNSRIMSNMPKADSATILPIEEKVTLWMKLKPISYLAAMLIGAALIIRVAMPTFTSKSDTYAHIDLDEVSDEFIQQTIDEAMFDNYSMYVYLSENMEDYEE